MTENFLKGVFIGFSIAAPVGPIGLLCLRRSIVDGRTAGFVSGLGAATADAVYGTFAALGLTAVTHFLLGWQSWIRLFGSLALVAIGLSMMRAKTATAAAGPIHARTLFAAYASTFALTLSNPTTILAFIGIFAGLGIGADRGGFAPAALLVTGVFLGSTVWWFVLSAAANWLSGRFGAGRPHAIGLASGSLIVAFGLWQLAALTS